MKSLDIFNELSDHITIKINSCRELYHDGAWVENKIHNDYDLWLILDGDMTIDINGATYHAVEGDIVFFYPGVPYSAFMGQNGCRFIFIHFYFGIGNNFSILNDFNFAGIIPAELLGEDVKLFKEGWSDGGKSGVPSILLKAYFTVLLCRIMDVCIDVNIKRYCFPQEYHHKNTGKLDILRPIFKFILENLNKKIKINELSCIACMSEKYFINFFKDAIGVSPLVYMNQLKMNRARSYIYQRKFSVKQIASLLGYSDQYTFSKAFKKHFNVSPSKFV